MKVLILSPYPENILNAIKETNDNYLIYNDKISKKFLEDNNIEFIISYGYKFILEDEITVLYENNIINLHISFLPFNRGAYPNLWSHLEDTPSGISIHQIDDGIDTGNILMQKKLYFNPKIHTFKSSYKILNMEITNLFNENWKLIKENRIKAAKPIGKGSYKSKDEGLKILELFENGWDTKIINAINIYKSYLKTQ